MPAKLLFIILIVFICSVGCKNKSVYSNHHLRPQVMQKVLIDLNLAEAYSTQRIDSLHKAGAKNYDSLSVYYTYILDHYKITQEQLTESLNWYKDHPTEMDSIYTNMLPIVTRWQSKFPGK